MVVYSNEETKNIYSKIHAALDLLFKTFDFSESSNSNVDQLLSFIAPCIGRDVAELKRICNSRNISNADLIADLRKATLEGGTDYSFILNHFSTSINTIYADEADGIIASFQSEIRTAIKTLLESEEPLELWVPDETLSHAEFLRALKIPASSKNEPDMLLHNLGSFQRKDTLRKQVNTLFHSKLLPGGHIGTTLLNTSGSGKTRTVLEGLCRSWGLYFTCQVDETAHGSADLQNTLLKRIPNDACFKRELPPTDFRRVNEVNCQIAQDRLGEVLLARLCILELFCEVAVELSGGVLTDEHRRRWVILQIRPSCIRKLAPSDIFDRLTDKLIGIDKEYRAALIQTKLEDLRSILVQEADGPPLLCVVDEAQIAAVHLEDAFMTLTSTLEALRSSLREVTRAFAIPGLPMSLNLTGTGLRQDKIKDIMSSAIFKDDSTTMVTHFGSFSQSKLQTAYMKQFIPPALAREERFKELFKRAAYWLRGRYRFTAAYMKDLLLTGFEKPHLLLNAFIRFSTRFPIPRTAGTLHTNGFKPTDSKGYWEEGDDPTPSAMEYFKFEELKENSHLENIIRHATSQFWMRSEFETRIVDNGHFDLMASGFARYAEDDTANPLHAKVTLDEPLVLLALSEWLQVYDLPLVEQIRMRAATAVTNANGANGLEEYLAIYFSAVFDAETPLTDIFRFNPHIEAPDWAEKPATLVSLYRSEGDNTLREGVVAHQSRPSATIGKSASSVPDTLKWLGHKDKERAPICFPDKLLGPDLIFVLKLDDEQESKIWVAVQSKFSGENTLPSEVLRKAIPSITPGKFYGLRNESTKEGEKPKDGKQKKTAAADEEAKKRKRADADEKKRKENNEKALGLLDALPNRLRMPVLAAPSKGQKIADVRQRVVKRRLAEEKYRLDLAKYSVDLAKWNRLREGSRPVKPAQLPPEQPLTSEERAVLQGAGVHSLLRVVVGWPSHTALHTRGATLLKDLHHYFDEENHPIVELDIGTWGRTMEVVNPRAGSYVDYWNGRKRRPTSHEDALPNKKRKISASDHTGSLVKADMAVMEALRGGAALTSEEEEKSLTPSEVDDRGATAGPSTPHRHATSPPLSTAYSTYSRTRSQTPIDSVHYGRYPEQDADSDEIMSSVE